MAKIEINTTRNVFIEYELAEWKERSLAFILDRGVSIIAAFFTGLLIRNLESEWFPRWVSKDWLLVIWILVFFVTFSLWTEILMNGQSPGKKAMGLRVIRIDGKELSLKNHFIRWALRLADVYLSGGLIASVLVATGKWKQRLGDQVAHTVVVNQRSARNFNLAELELLRTSQQYQAQYPEVKQVGEDLMLSIKYLLQRYEKNPNSHHRQLIADTSRALKKKLGVESDENDKAFLVQLLRDYVILTR
jgi:uncharacterized RDD family membrane protein YckC